MKLFKSPSGSSPLPKLQYGSRVGAPPSSEPPPLPPGWSDSLFNRVVLAGDPRASVVPVLEKWIDEGKSVDKRGLQSMVKQMRGFRRHWHALEISKWMSDRRYFPLSPGDHADRVDLLSKVHGIEHAENYFSNISKQLKFRQPYGALLNCYAEKKAVEKAEALFREMKDLKLLTSFSYNVLIKLYSLSGHHDKVGIVFQEMEEKGIPPDNFTFTVLMDAYVVASDIDGIEKLLTRIKNPGVAVDWYTYACAAKGYSKAGMIDKALAALKKSERLVPQKKGRVAYGFLLAAYSDIGKKDEVYRIWNRYKSMEKASNSVYMCMISCLLKLDDFEGAEAILGEWDSASTVYDFRVPNMLVGAYCKKGLPGKAESLVSDAIGSGRIPFANTWDRLAGAYFEGDQIPKAVEMMKKGLAAAGHYLWKPNPENISASLDYFRVQKDVEAAEEFVSLLRRLSPLTRGVYHCLLRTYIVAGKPVSSVLDRMKEDGYDVDEEAHKIIGGVNL